jgi:heme/copper-type cytochrome/quinol oxidase subunit 1
MTSIQTHHAVETSATPSAIATWLTSTDHKVVGRLYIGTGLVGMLGGLVLAVLVAFERINADSYQILSDATSVQVLAVARNLLTFGGVVPLLFGLMLAIVPLQLGSRGIAFPRLAMGSFWMWLVGLGMMVASIIGNGGPGGGNAELVDLYLAAFIVMLLGLAMAATSLVVTILTSRTPGMGILRAPLLTWSALVTSVGVLLTVPVLIGTTVYVYVDHRYARLGFGGNKGVNTWIGWALSQPFTYLLAIPALGVVLDAVPVLSRNRLAQRPAAVVAVALVGIAAVSAVTQKTVTLPWGGDGFLSGLGTKIADLLPFVLLNVLPVFGLLGVLGLSLLTLKEGKPVIAAPLAFSLVGLLGIVLGASSHILGGIEDAGLQGTIYETGSYVGITFGSVIVAFGALCFWGPKLWGRRISDKAALPLVLLALGAIGLGSLPYMIAGFADQPAGLLNGFSYDGPQALWNVLTTIGFTLMLILTAAFTALAFKSFTSGDVAGDDPWDGTTLEWATSSPPPSDNFADVMVVNSATPLADLKSTSTGKDA